MRDIILEPIDFYDIDMCGWMPNIIGNLFATDIQVLSIDNKNYWFNTKNFRVSSFPYKGFYFRFYGRLFIQWEVPNYYV